MRTEQQADMRRRLEEYLQKARVDDVAQWADFIETDMVGFLREFVDASYGGIYVETRRAFYDDARLKLAINNDMRHADKQSGQRLSRALKLYSEFLQSKYSPKPELPMERVLQKKARPNPQRQAAKHAIPDEGPRTEGARRHVELERPYRNSALRRDCIAYWGAQCQCCGMDFASLYGEELGGEYIEVHHLKPISTIEGEHDVDPVRDLVPLCANCHAMIHRGADGPLTLAQLRAEYRGTVREIKRRREDT